MMTRVAEISATEINATEVGVAETREVKLETTPQQFEVEVFYDGDCPLCRREIAFLQHRDRQNKIRFTDLASPEFSAERLGKNHETMMSQIHGRLPDGQWIVGVEVFRRLYAAIGWTTPVRLTRLPVVKTVLDCCYRWFAKYRLRLTGRCTDKCRVPNQGHPSARTTPSPPK